MGLLHHDLVLLPLPLHPATLEYTCTLLLPFQFHWDLHAQQHLFGTCCIPGWVPGSRDVAVSSSRYRCCPHGTHSLNERDSWKHTPQSQRKSRLWLSFTWPECGMGEIQPAHPFPHSETVSCADPVWGPGDTTGNKTDRAPVPGALRTQWETCLFASCT